MEDAGKEAQSGEQSKPTAAPLRAMGSPVSMRSRKNAIDDREASPNESQEDNARSSTATVGAQFLAMPASLQGAARTSQPSSPPPAEKFTPPRHVSDSVSTGSLENIVLSEADAQAPPVRPPVIVTSAAAVNPPPSPYSDASDEEHQDARKRGCCCSTWSQCLFQCLSLALMVSVAATTGLVSEMERVVTSNIGSEMVSSAMAKLMATFGATIMVFAMGIVAVCLVWPILVYGYIVCLCALLVAYLFVARECRDALFYNYSTVVESWRGLSDSARSAIQMAGHCCGGKTRLDYPGTHCPADIGGELAGCRYALREIMGTASDAMKYTYVGAVLVFAGLAGLAVVATRRPRSTSV